MMGLLIYTGQKKRRGGREKPWYPAQVSTEISQDRRKGQLVTIERGNVAVEARQSRAY